MAHSFRNESQELQNITATSPIVGKGRPAASAIPGSMQSVGAIATMRN
jgi:hypothetical protein